MADGITLANALQAADTLLVTVILGVLVTMFVRGDVLSRTVYEKMTENIIQRVTSEIATRVLAGVSDMLDSWRCDGK